MTRYSQNDEEDVIVEFFKGRTGRFLDVGAFDGVTMSNTRALAELGWSGLMVEPNPHNLSSLIYSLQPFDGRVQACSAAVSVNSGVANLRVDETPGREWASSICPYLPQILKPSAVGVIVPTVRIQRLLEYGPFDFISIDAEGMDFLILKDCPKNLGGCDLFSIEPSGIPEREIMKRYLIEECGFTIHHETNENIIARRV